MLFAGSANGLGAGLVEAGDDVGAGVELDVDDADTMGPRPGDRVLQWQFAPDIDADSVQWDGRHVCLLPVGFGDVGREVRVRGSGRPGWMRKPPQTGASRFRRWGTNVPSRLIERVSSW